MPRKKLKSKQSKYSDTKSENSLSTGISSPYQEEITSSDGNSSSNSTAVKNEDTSNVSEKHEETVSDVSSHIPAISETGKSSNGDISGLKKDGSSASFLQEMKEIDNAENLKTTDATLTDATSVILDEENTAIQEKSSEAFLLDYQQAGPAMKNESVCEQISFPDKSTYSENVNQEELSEETNLLDSTVSIDATVKEDTVCESKLFNVEASRDESITHQEKTSDEDTLSSESVEPEIQEIKKVTENDREKTSEVDLNSYSSTKSHPMNVVEGNNTEIRPKCTSLLVTLNTDSQFPISSGKGRGKTRAQFNHTTDASASEHKRKRAKTTSAVASPNASQKTNNRRNLKRRVKSEAIKKMSELASSKTSKKVISSTETSFRAKEKNVGRGSRGRRNLHRAARGSIICKIEKGELLKQSKLEVSPKQKKRKSTENATSDSSEKALEAISSKRKQKGSEALASSTQESKSSSRVKQTSSRLLRPRKNKSTSGEITDKPPPCTVISITESITEYLGEAAYWVTRDIPYTMEESIKRESKKYEPQVYMPTSTDKSNMIVITQTQSVREYLELPEDSPTDEMPIQPIMRVLSNEVSSIGAEHLDAASSIPDRNLNVTDIPVTESVKSSTETEAERSPTVSSSENIEADIHRKNNSINCRSARPKMRCKNTQEISPQSGYRREYVADILEIKFSECSTEAGRFPAVSSREDVKEIHSHCEQSSSTICRGARPKMRDKITRISPRRLDDSGRPGLAVGATGSKSNNNELYPSFAEFKETLGVDRVEVVHINNDVFDKALGINRSSDHSITEHRQEFKVISPKRFSEAVSYDEKKFKSTGSGTGSNDPQSSEMVEQVFFPTIEEFRNTLHLHEFPPFHGNLLEMFNKALEEMESKNQKLQSESKIADPADYEPISSEDESMTARSEPVEVIQEFPSREIQIQRDPFETSESSAANSDESRGKSDESSENAHESRKSGEEMESKNQKLQSNKIVEYLISKGEDPSTSPRKKSPERQINEANSQNSGSSNPCYDPAYYEPISSDDEFTTARSVPVEVIQEFPSREVQIRRDPFDTSEVSAAKSDESSEKSDESSEKSDESTENADESSEKSDESTENADESREFGEVSSESSRVL